MKILIPPPYSYEFVPRKDIWEFTVPRYRITGQVTIKEVRTIIKWKLRFKKILQRLRG